MIKVLLVTEQKLEHIEKKLKTYNISAKFVYAAQEENAIDFLRNYKGIVVLDGNLSWVTGEIIDTIGSICTMHKKILISRSGSKIDYLAMLQAGYDECIGELDEDVIAAVIIKEYFAASQENKYKMLLRNVQDIIIYFDKKGQIVEHSQAANTILQYKGRELLHQNIQDIFKSDFFMENDKLVFAHLHAGKVTRTTGYKKNTTCFPVDLMVYRRIPNEAGIYLAIARDVSKIVKEYRTIAKNNKKLQEQAQIKTEFVANVAHELRTPINGMTGLIKTLYNTELSNEQRDTMQVIENCCSNMSKIISDLLDHAKMESGKMELDEQRFDIWEMMEEIKQVNLILANNKDLAFTVNVSNIPQYLIGDKLRITQILNNLLSNAFKFTMVGGVFVEVVLTKKTEDYVELFFLVSDTGIGISENEKSKLFRYFSQVDASITRKYGGTGLGLAISMNLVKKMNGVIHVTSKKGSGSSFSFTIQLKIGKDEDEGIDLGNWPRLEIQAREENHKMQNGKRASIRELMTKMDLAISTRYLEKAEILAKQIKELLPAKDDTGRKMILKIELKLRKEDFVNAQILFQQLDKTLCEVNYYD